MEKNRLETTINKLQDHKQEWADLSIDRKLTMLTQLRSNLRQTGSRWVEAAVEAKKISEHSGRRTVLRRDIKLARKTIEK